MKNDWNAADFRTATTGLSNRRFYAAFAPPLTVYRRGYKERLEPIREYLNCIGGLQVIGRYGSFKYNNQDHSILMGVLAAENVLINARHDLWSVNADYDTYQEGSAITETGLAPSKKC